MAGSADTTIFTTMTALAEKTGAINLGQGFPDEDGPKVVIDAAVEALRSGHNQYAPLPGIPALREAVARHQRLRYGIELDPDTQGQVTFGATEALASALLALVRPGDEVAMLDPSYDSYAAVVALAGGVPRPIPLPPPGWRGEAAPAEPPVSQRTRVQSGGGVGVGGGGEEPRKLARSLAEKRDLLAEGLAAAGFEVLHSSGTYFLTADARPLGFDDAVALCERLPLEAGVVAIPIAAFTAEPAERVRPLVRFAFCKRREVLEDAVSRLKAWRA